MVLAGVAGEKVLWGERLAISRLALNVPIVGFRMTPRTFRTKIRSSGVTLVPRISANRARATAASIPEVVVAAAQEAERARPMEYPISPVALCGAIRAERFRAS